MFVKNLRKKNCKQTVTSRNFWGKNCKYFGFSLHQRRCWIIVPRKCAGVTVARGSDQKKKSDSDQSTFCRRSPKYVLVVKKMFLRFERNIFFTFTPNMCCLCDLHKCHCTEKKLIKFEKTMWAHENDHF